MITENHLLRIDELYAFISSDEYGEGLCGFLSGSQWISMVAADKKRVDSLMKMAQHIANATGNEIRLIKLSVREDIEVIKPTIKHED